MERDISTNDDRPARQAPHSIWRGLWHTLQTDIAGGVLLLVATVAAVVLANTPAVDWYESVRDFRFGFDALHLELSVGSWAADGLLAIFFFVVGLELKEEFVVGKLRDPKAAALPIAAAIGGVIVPALIFAAITASAGPDSVQGWAIPTATDIAFAVAVIAVVGRKLPPALRVFLLTLAIVDDLIAITIIATVYSSNIDLLLLGAALIPLAIFAVLVHRGVRSWWLLIPLAVTTWGLVHASGVHATVAGVLLGFVVPVVARGRAKVEVGRDSSGEPEYDGLAAHFADRWSPLSTLVAVPIFAFFSAGVTIGGIDGPVEALSDPIALGIVVGLVLGKPIGILTTTFLMTRVPGLALDPTLRWPDVVGLGFVAGIGFTVSLLIGELSYGAASEADAHVKIGVLVGSLIAALIGGGILAARNAKAARLVP